MLTSLGVASNAKTVSRLSILNLVFGNAFVYLFGRIQSSKLMRGYISKLISLVFVVFCTLAAFSDGSAQVVRKATDKAVDVTPTTRRRERKRVRTAVVAKIPDTIESDKFLDLGDSFRGNRQWNAAEAAYKEAINIWSGNADALLKLGFLYIDRNRLPEAQGVYSKLRAVDASFAADLFADIDRYKKALR